MSFTRYKLVFFAPHQSTTRILDHLFTKFPENLGKIGQYEQCAFICRGIGQFRPLAGANPAIGAVGQLEHVEEDRVELVVHDRGDREDVRSAVSELKNVHPYEEIVYDIYKLEEL